jgi:hypothetical protein
MQIIICSTVAHGGIRLPFFGIEEKSEETLIRAENYNRGEGRVNQTCLVMFEYVRKF